MTADGPMAEDFLDAAQCPLGGVQYLLPLRTDRQQDISGVDGFLSEHGEHIGL